MSDQADADVRTILVLANETLVGRELVDAVKARAQPGPSRVLVVAPVTRPRAGYVVYRDSRRASAGRRLDRVVKALQEAGIPAHGAVYDDLMNDRNPMTYEQVQERLASAETLAAAIEALREDLGDDPAGWDEIGRLAFCGVVVRHAELGVPIPDDLRERALKWLESETIDWDEATQRGRLGPGMRDASGRG